MPSLRVLIVEDEWLIAQDYAGALRRAGHHVIGPFAQPSAALVPIGTEPIDVALLDFQLGSQNSSQLAERLRQAGIPFAVISGHHPRDLSAELAAAPLLSKPVDRVELIATVMGLAQGR